MKTTFTSKELPHQWAHQLAPHGKCPGNERFDGASYYSYGTEIGRILKRGKRKAFLLNETSYSITTSGHQSFLARSIPESEIQFRIDGIGRGCFLEGIEGKFIFDCSVKQAAVAANHAARAKKNKDWHTARQARYLEQARQVSKFFGLRRKVDTKTVDRLAARIAAQDAKEAKQGKERQARLAKTRAVDVMAWLAGEQVCFPFGIERVYLRAMSSTLAKVFGPPPKGLGWPEGATLDVLETSKGVKVSLDDAKHAYRFAQKVRAKGWHRNGETFAIGQFQLDAVNDAGIVAGCHRICWKELERFAATQGW